MARIPSVSINETANLGVPARFVSILKKKKKDLHTGSVVFFAYITIKRSF